MSDDLSRFFAKNTDAPADGRSPLIRAKAKARGATVNACPFGCEDSELDANGYCDHLIGWTVPETDRVFHARKKILSKDGRDTGEYVIDPTPRTVLPDDKLEKGTVSCRVYRQSGDPGDEQLDEETPKAKRGKRELAAV